MEFRVELRLTRGANPHVYDGTIPTSDRFYALQDTGNPVVPSGPTWVLDGFRVGWDLEEWPGQPSPLSASLSLLCEDPESLPPLEEGVWVHAIIQGRTFKSGGVAGTYLTYLGTYLGKITEAEAVPVMVQGKPMVAVSITADDATAAWAELMAPSNGTWPQESLVNRITHILGAAGFANNGPLTTGFPADSVPFRPLDVDARPMTEVLEDHLRQVYGMNGEVSAIGGAGGVGPGYMGWHRPYLSAKVEAGARRPTPSIKAHTERGGHEDSAVQHNAAGGPRALAIVGGMLTHLAADVMSDGRPAVGAVSVSAAVASPDLSWKRSKLGLPNRTLVTPAGDTLFEGAPAGGRPGYNIGYRWVQATHDDLITDQGVITRSEESTLVQEYAAQAMADGLLPDRSDYRGRWTAEEVTVMAGALDDDKAVRALFVNPPLIPHHGKDTDAWANLGQPYGQTVHIHSVADGWRLESSYLAGQLMGVQIDLQGAAGDSGRVNVTLSLSRTVRRQWEIGSAVPAWGIPDLTAYFNNPARPASLRTLKQDPRTVGLTYDQVDPTFTYMDARLTRNEVL